MKAEVEQSAMRRHDLTDKQWSVLKRLLPEPSRYGRPAKDHLTILNGVLFVLRTGCPWRDLPTCYGKWSTIANRFYRWVKQNVWEQVLKRLQELSGAKDDIDWEEHFLDSSVVRAHRDAAGAKGGKIKRRWDVHVGASVPRSISSVKAAVNL